MLEEYRKVHRGVWYSVKCAGGGVAAVKEGGADAVRRSGEVRGKRMRR